MAKVTLVFEGDSAAEVQHNMSEYLAATTAQVTSNASTSVTPAAAGSGAPKSGKTKKDTKEPTPAPAAAPVVEAEPNPFDTDEQADDEEEVLSFESVTEQLKAVGEKCGVPKVRDILKAVGKTRAKDLEESDFKKVSDACAKALA